ncbi:MAG: hypothetical protein LBR06_05020 [Bacteroidales bacterium]|nr:hypothetical protein [Bacteroidales bacterium]
MLERIIARASNETDIVLDPFVGGGTTVAVKATDTQGLSGRDSVKIKVEKENEKIVHYG